MILALAAACSKATTGPEPSDVGPLPAPPSVSVQDYDENDDSDEEPHEDDPQKIIGLKNPKGDSAKRGKDLFFQETFDGARGIACGDCHQKKDFMGLTTARVQHLKANQPSHPLFNPLDGDFGGNTYNRLETTATIRIPFDLPSASRGEDETGFIVLDSLAQPVAPDAYSDAAGFHPFGASDPDYLIKPNGDRVIFVARSTPDTVNLALDTEFLFNGNETDLAVQAAGAVKTHAGLGFNLPTAQEGADLAAFQKGLFSSKALKKQAKQGIPAVLPPGNTPEEIAGRSFFVSGQRGLCAQCHSGPDLDTTDEFNVTQSLFFQLPPTKFASNFSSILEPPNPHLPKRLFIARDAFGNMRPMPPVHDPGTLLSTWDPCFDLATCILNSGAPGFPPLGTADIFRISSLHGLGKKIAAGHRFMHNNAFGSIDAVVAHYAQLFAITAAGAQAATGQDFSYLLLSPADQAAIIAYAKIIPLAQPVS
jgi:hypothetical protein